MARQYRNWIEEIQYDLLNLREKFEAQMNALTRGMYRLERDADNCWENLNADERFMKFQDKMIDNERAQKELIPLIEQIESMQKMIRSIVHSDGYHYPVYSDSERLVQEIQSGCQELADEIIIKICKRAIKTINLWGRNYIGFGEDYPTKFTAFDVLSVELQSKYYEELNPFLRDAIDGTLEHQYDSLSSLESFILDYSECSDHNGIDREAVQSKILKKFNEMLNEHYQLKKIQDFEEKRAW